MTTRAGFPFTRLRDLQTSSRAIDMALISAGSNAPSVAEAACFCLPAGPVGALRADSNLVPPLSVPASRGGECCRRGSYRNSTPILVALHKSRRVHAKLRDFYQALYNLTTAANAVAGSKLRAVNSRYDGGWWIAGSEREVRSSGEDIFQNG
jgi:hypothetical protein